MELSRRLFALIFFALISTSLNTQAQLQSQPSITKPPDLKFMARLLSDSHQFHTGQSIEMEISYLSDAEKKYQMSRTNPNPDLGGVTPHVSPDSGIVTLLDLRRDLITGFAGSFPSGGPEFLSPKPITDRFDLGYWYRFQKPGTYSVVVSSNVVWQMKTLQEGGGRKDTKSEIKRRGI